jgi:hypothetical protein
MQNERSQLGQLGLGLLFIGAGVLFLLQNLGVFGGFSPILWALIFAAGAFLFLALFIGDYHQRWWAAIPGMTLFGLAGAALFDTLNMGFLGQLGGPFFLASIGAGFVLVFATNPSFWWAIIPGGVLGTLALVAAVEEFGDGRFEAGSVFFLGLGITFLVLGLLPRADGRALRWALIPAGVLLLLGLLVNTPAIAYVNYIWPVALIIGGAYLLWRGYKEQGRQL